MERNAPRPSDLHRLYDDDFFGTYETDVRSSAQVIAPIAIDLVHPSSVLDVGCGRGDWLRTFADLGVRTVVGVDGPHIRLDDLAIPSDAFVRHDLRQPLDLGRIFDLVVSLEVAEHL